MSNQGFNQRVQAWTTCPGKSMALGAVAEQFVPRVPEAWTLHAGAKMHLLSLGVTDAELLHLEQLLAKKMVDREMWGGINGGYPVKVYIRKCARNRFRKGARAALFGFSPLLGKNVNRSTRRANVLIYELPAHAGSDSDPWKRLFVLGDVDLNMKPD